MRIAVIGTPRSGNVWLRSTLATALDLPPFAEHNWTSFPDTLPDKCIVGVHWYREPNFQNYLKCNGFRVIALARHPLDVMLSILSFSQREPTIAMWLGGNVAIPSEMYGANPTDRSFLDWTTSFGAENLLSVSYQWWNDADSIKIKYEDILPRPVDAFARLLEELGAKTVNLRASLTENNFTKFNSLPNRHGWQGVAGLFRSLFLQEHASAIYNRHHEVFKTLGYSPPVSEATSVDRIRSNWSGLCST